MIMLTGTVLSCVTLSTIDSLLHPSSAGSIYRWVSHRFNQDYVYFYDAWFGVFQFSLGLFRWGLLVHPSCRRNYPLDV